MNYCKDCAHFRIGLGNHPQCDKFSGVETTEDPVWGIRETKRTTFCEHERGEYGKCGPDGKGFVQIDYQALLKPPTPTRQSKIAKWFHC